MLSESPTARSHDTLGYSAKLRKYIALHDGALLAFDPKHGTCAPLAKLPFAPKRLEVARDGTILAYAPLALSVLDARGTLRFSFSRAEETGDTFESACLSLDGRYFATGNEQALRVYDATSGVLARQILRRAKHGVSALAWHAAGLLVAGGDGSLEFLAVAERR